MKKLKQRVTQLVDFSKSSQAIILLATEMLLGVGIVMMSLSIFLKLADDVLEKETISVDSTIIHIIYSFRSPLLTNIMNIFSFFGGEVFLGGVILLTIILLFKKHKKDAAAFSFILSFGLFFNLILKNMFHRPRPQFLPLVHETTFSFPSGHAMNSFVFYISLYYFIFRKTKNKNLRIALSTISMILVLCIGISRVYLGAHYPSDVIAGYLAGLIWFGMVLLFKKLLLFFRLFKEYEFEKGYTLID